MAKHYQSVIETLIATGAVKATKFVDPKNIVRATRRTYNGSFNKRTIELSVTIGRPNYKELAFIKQCVKAGEKFPVKKIQLKFLQGKKKK